MISFEYTMREPNEDYSFGKGQRGDDLGFVGIGNPTEHHTTALS